MKLRQQFTKNLHVSPFMDMNFIYQWTSNTPSKNLTLHIANIPTGEPEQLIAEVKSQTSGTCQLHSSHKAKLFDATLALERIPISKNSLNRILIQFPLMTVKVIAGIYWQACKLWLKGVPFYTRPKPHLPMIK